MGHVQHLRWCGILGGTQRWSVRGVHLTQSLLTPVGYKDILGWVFFLSLKWGLWSSWWELEGLVHPFLLVFHYPSLPDCCHRARAFRFGLCGGKVMHKACTKLPTQISGLCLHGSHSLVTSCCLLFVSSFSSVTHLFQLRQSSSSAGRAGSLCLQSTGEKTSEFRSETLIIP